MSVTCTANLREVRPSADMALGPWLRAAFGPSRPCGKPARWQSTLGPRCTECANEAADALTSDKTLAGLLLAAHGQQPKTREEAFARFFVALS